MSLASVQDLAERLGTQFDPTDVRALRALEDASALIEGYTNRSFALVEDDEVVLHGTGTQTLLLPEFPVIEVTEVVLLDVDGTETVLAAWGDGPWGSSQSLLYYRLLVREGILVRLDCFWPKGYGNVRVTYTHGYETIPAAVKAACIQIAARLESSLISAGSSGPITGETIGSYRVDYASGSSSVSSSSGLTDDEMALLNPYRQRNLT